MFSKLITIMNALDIRSTQYGNLFLLSRKGWKQRDLCSAHSRSIELHDRINKFKPLILNLYSGIILSPKQGHRKGVPTNSI